MIFYVFGGAGQAFLGPTSGKFGGNSRKRAFFKMAAKTQLVDIVWLIETIILVETWQL